MRTRSRARTAVFVALTASAFPGARILSAESATATVFVSATVLGPAGEQTALGAVTISRLAGESELVELSRPGAAASTLARFRVVGGTNAAFTIGLPERVVVRGERSELAVTGFRASGAKSRALDGAGAGVLSVGADVRIPAGQAPGRYSGSYAVTIAYN
jgi:hypothetical protein